MRRETERSRPSVWSQVARTVRRIVGAPDYAAYVEHCTRAGHAPPVSEKEYVREFFENRRAGVRCC